MNLLFTLKYLSLLVSIIHISQALYSVDETMDFKLSTHSPLNLTHSNLITRQGNNYQSFQLTTDDPKHHFSLKILSWSCCTLSTNTVDCGVYHHTKVSNVSNSTGKGVPTKWCVLPVRWNTATVKHDGSRIQQSVGISLSTMLIFGCGMMSSGQIIALYIAAPENKIQCTHIPSI